MQKSSKMTHAVSEHPGRSWTAYQSPVGSVSACRDLFTSSNEPHRTETGMIRTNLGLGCLDRYDMNKART